MGNGKRSSEPPGLMMVINRSIKFVRDVQSWKEGEKCSLVK